MLLTALGTVFGMGALVAMTGLTTTAGEHIIGRFDELAATEVRVVPVESDGPQTAVSLLPWDAEDRLQRLNGVVGAGTLSILELPDVRVRTTAVVDPLSSNDRAAPIVAASPGLLPAVHGVVGSGRWFDNGYSGRGDRVVVLGRNLAESLNVGDVSRRVAVFVGDHAYTVIGILSDVRREPSLLNSVLLPDGTARLDFGLTAPTSVRIDTQIGAARLIAGQARLALAPQEPERLRVLQESEPAVTRAKVSEDVRVLLVLVGAVSLVIGALGIANTTLVAVLERTAEIGLRRSLGATRATVAGQFLLESVGIGLFGGLLGAALGVLTTVGVSYAQTWTPVLDPLVAPVAVAVGGLTGLAAGAFPAWRAATVEPIAALRNDG
ncbi:ABC transporter permease [Salinispora arenicola]|nr:ABC transporter permease [Salinispora arenicola]